ncbi:MAG TPA: nitroreductase family protein, partial [Aliidongia sp.]|uniref:nitroreductase family protein n=1 Tax=Aliidongia sp. TaxID=1914230 RepID=UPI002DDDA64C
MLSQRSVRAYLPDALPQGTAERIVAAAQSAATSSNLQTWSVVAVEDLARKARLSEVAASQRHVRECPLLLVWLADLSRLDGVAARQSAVLDGADYLESFIVAFVDAALA